jgi:outer membrane murein-binding lipoprotein Lpp
MELLEDTHSTYSIDSRLENVRRALREHIKAALVKAARRKSRRA